MPRAHRLEYVERIRVISHLLFDKGYSDKQIESLYRTGEIFKLFSFSPQKTKSLGYDQCWRDLRLARNRLLKGKQEELDDPKVMEARRAFHKERLNRLYQKALNQNNVNASIAIERELMEMDGVKRNQPLQIGEVKIYNFGSLPERKETKQLQDEAVAILLDNDDAEVVDEPQGENDQRSEPT